MLRRQKRIAVQLETLAEFVEYHLGEEEGGRVCEEVEEALRLQAKGDGLNKTAAG